MADNILLQNITLSNDSDIRVIPISNYNLTTEYIEPKFMKFIVNHKNKYSIYKIIITEPDITKQLNELKTSIIKRIRYMTMLPVTDTGTFVYDQDKYYINVKMVNKIMFKNIIEHNDELHDVDYKNMLYILESKSKLVLKINSLVISSKNVYLDISLVKIIPETLNKKILFFKDMLFTKNLQSMNVMHVSKKNKYEIRDELIQLLSRTGSYTEKL